MPEHRVIRDPGEAAAASPDEMVLVRSGDLARWIGAARDVQEAVEAERQACVTIVEHHLRLLMEERNLDAKWLMERVVHRIEARSEGSSTARPPS